MAIVTFSPKAQDSPRKPNQRTELGQGEADDGLDTIF